MSRKKGSIAYVALMDGMRNAYRYKILSREPEEERALERTGVGGLKY
jgi:hypothetical protein